MPISVSASKHLLTIRRGGGHKKPAAPSAMVCIMTLVLLMSTLTVVWRRVNISPHLVDTPLSRNAIVLPKVAKGGARTSGAATNLALLAPDTTSTQDLRSGRKDAKFEFSGVNDSRMRITTAPCPDTESIVPIDSNHDGTAAASQRPPSSCPWNAEAVAQQHAQQLIDTPELVTQLLLYNKKAIAKLIRERPTLWRAYLRPGGGGGTIGDTNEPTTAETVAAQRCRQLTPECSVFSTATTAAASTFRQASSSTGGRGLTTLREARRLFAIGGDKQKSAAKQNRSGDDATAVPVYGSGSKWDDESFLFAKCCAEHQALRASLICWEDMLLQYANNTTETTSNTPRPRGEAAKGKVNGEIAKLSDSGAPPWWLVFGSLLSFVRSAIPPHASLSHQLDVAAEDGSPLTSSDVCAGFAHPTIIPWDTDLDLMMEPDTAFASFVERAMSKGLVWTPATQLSFQQQQHLAHNNATAKRTGSSQSGALIPQETLRCHAMRAPEQQRQHVHGDLVGFVFASTTSQQVDVDAASTLRDPPPMSSTCPDNACSRVEVWLRNDKKKTQRRQLIFPLRRDIVPHVQRAPLRLYGTHSAHVPQDFVEVLRQGYGDRWCRPCKHRTSACKNVSHIS